MERKVSVKNMKNKVPGILLWGFIILILTGCTKVEQVKVGMLIEGTGIGDRSFKQGIWSGVLKAEQELGLETVFMSASAKTTNHFIKKVKEMYDEGCRIVIAPGNKYSSTVETLQSEYEDVIFILVDGKTAKEYDNTICIIFSEYESGFLAGAATALELHKGRIAFIGGEVCTPVEEYKDGFLKGVAYVNGSYGTNCVISEEDIIYSGSFTDYKVGYETAKELYDRGVVCIFTAAGEVGNGAIDQAVERRRQGDEVWIVGSDIDQYKSGIYNEKDSVVLTSALKDLESAVYEAIYNIVTGKETGGCVMKYGIENGGVGIPENNPNLSAETIHVMGEIYKEIKKGTLKIK